MRFLASVVIASTVLLPLGSLAQERATAGAAPPQPATVDRTAPPICQVADPICVTAISGTSVVAVVAANAITGGALAPILLAGNGGVAASVMAAWVAVHVLELTVLGGGSYATTATGVADPVIAAANDAYTTTKSYVVSAADSVSTAASDAATAVGNWLPGGGQPPPVN